MAHPSKAAAALPDLTPVTGNYRPLIEIGRGGMARVYLAERSARGMRKLVVLKVLDPMLAASQEMRADFRREAILCARLNHPNIVQVFEVCDDTATPMMVMEYVEGVTLAQVRSRLGAKFPLRLHAHVISQCLGALHYFHGLRSEEGELQEPVHRDVSPQNVLVMHEGVVKVLDFGIAKIHGPEAGDATRTGIVKGKLAYMPPEQVYGDKTIDRRADVFAAGVMLWEAFAGRRMWQGRQESDLVSSLVLGAIPPIREACPSVSEAWERIIGRAVASNRNERYATALEMQIDIENALGELGGPVAQRELAEFMKAELIGLRTEQHERVAAALRGVSVPLAQLLAEPELDARSLTVTPFSTGRTLGAVAPEVPRHSTERWFRVTPWVLLLGVAGIAAVAAGKLDSSAAPAPEEPPSARAADQQQLIALSVVAAPVDATVRFNGKPVGANPWSTRLPASDGTAYVEVTAPGHQPWTQEVKLNADVALAVQLEPAPAPTTSPTPPAPAPESAPLASGTSAKAARPKQPAAPPTTASTSRKCTPPYTIDTHGIKTFKPECL